MTRRTAAYARILSLSVVLGLPGTGFGPALAAEPPAKKPLTTAEVLAASAPADWRTPDPANTL